jgi:osmotically-inducible protein OsmY
MKEGKEKNRIEGKMTKGSPDYIKRLVSIKGARLAPQCKGDLVTLSGQAKKTIKKNVANKFARDVHGVKSVMNQMTIEESN